jgi:hypothetical protein
MTTTTQFVSAPAGWRVQQVYVQDTDVVLDFPLAGWLMDEDGTTVPAFYSQISPAEPHMKRAVTDESEGVFYWITGPDEELLSEFQIATEIAQVESSWAAERKLSCKLGLSFEDARVLHYEGIQRYEEYLAVPAYERVDVTFAKWVELTAAEALRTA